MIVQYIVRYHWTGSYCSGWVDSRSFDTVEEANRFVSRLKRGESWKIIERKEETIAKKLKTVKVPKN